MSGKAKEIVLIAPYVDLYEKAKTLTERSDYAGIEVVQANLDEGLAVAREKVASGAKVIISRGGTFTLLRDALRIPMVEISISAYDLVASYPQLIRLDEPLAIIGYRNIISGFDLVLDVCKDVRKIEITHESDVEALVSACVDEGIRIFAGGAIVADACRKRNLKCFMWFSSEASILAAFDTALRILSSAKREIELVNRYLTLIDYVHDGVIATDERQQIIVMNAPAAEILDVEPDSCIGKNLAELASFDSVIQEIAEGRRIVEEIRTLKDARVSLSSLPILVNQEVKGAVLVFQEVVRLQNLEQKVRMQLVKKGFVARHSFNAIIYQSSKIGDCISIARKFSKYDSPVLIEGATGVGKELFAQGIHNDGQRKSGPFVAVNCAALPPSLIESELFGYEEGAFTGGRKGGKAGMFEMAHRGTLFLDEIGELPLEMQGRLLRVIQEKEVVRIGGERVIPLDVRLICATNRNIGDRVEEGAFRRDLFYRINTLQFYIPPLDERPEDIPVIAQTFLERFSRQYGKHIVGFTDDAGDFLRSHHYAGNVRELRGMVERSVIICEREWISSDDVRFGLAQEHHGQSGEKPVPTVLPDRQGTLKDVEDAYIAQVFEANGRSVSRTCKVLGIGRTTLWRKLQQEH